jgi:hypothetical protein
VNDASLARLIVFLLNHNPLADANLIHASMMLKLP